MTKLNESGVDVEKLFRELDERDFESSDSSQPLPISICGAAMNKGATKKLSRGDEKVVLGRARRVPMTRRLEG